MFSTIMTNNRYGLSSNDVTLYSGNGCCLPFYHHYGKRKITKETTQTKIEKNQVFMVLSWGVRKPFHLSCSTCSCWDIRNLPEAASLQNSSPSWLHILNFFIKSDLIQFYVYVRDFLIRLRVFDLKFCYIFITNKVTQ